MSYASGARADYGESMSWLRRHPLPWLVVVFVVVGSLATASRSDAGGPTFVGAALALVAIFPVLLQRPRGWVVAVSGLCVGAYFTAGYGPGPIFFVLPAVTFAVALSLPLRRWVGWAIGGAALAVTGMMLNPDRPGSGSPAGQGPPWWSGGASRATCRYGRPSARSRSSPPAVRSRLRCVPVTRPAPSGSAG
jgi:hypothetical protein